MVKTVSITQFGGCSIWLNRKKTCKPFELHESEIATPELPVTGGARTSGGTCTWWGFHGDLQDPEQVQRTSPTEPPVPLHSQPQARGVQASASQVPDVPGSGSLPRRVSPRPENEAGGKGLGCSPAGTRCRWSGPGSSHPGKGKGTRTGGPVGCGTTLHTQTPEETAALCPYFLGKWG